MSVAVDAPEAVALKDKVDQQGLKVRDLKSSGAEKSAVDEAVQSLLQLKADYKALTGVDLAAGGSSKKDKKAKKAAASAQQPAAPQPKKQAKAKEQAKSQPPPAQQDKNPSAAAAPQSSPQSPAALVERDMSMTAVLGRLASRAGQADQIIAHLRTQITAVRQNAALSACKAEEERLRNENEALKRQVQDLKDRLTTVETMNGIKQVPLPARGAAVSAAASQPIAPTAAETPAAPAAEKKAPEAAAKGKPAKKEKKEAAKKPAAAAAGALPVDVSRLDMRIGQIVGVKKHPDADSLYVEEVDLGEDKPRTIVSGLVQHVPMEQMQDRIAIFMCNLKPAKMRGIFSNGMIMCGSTPQKVEIIEPPKGVKKGDRVYVEGFEGTPDEQLNPKKKIFEQVQPDLRISAEGVAVYKGAPWKVRGKEGLCTVPSMRDTPIK